MPPRFLPRFTALFLAAGLSIGIKSASAETYTALGASDVNGVGATNPATEGYVPLLGDWMNARSASGATYTVHKRAKDGFTAPQLNIADYDDVTPGTQLAVTDAVADNPDVVTLWIGSNDVLHMAAPALFPSSPYNAFGLGTDPLTLQTKVGFFAANYNSILDALQAGAPNRRIVTANIPLLGNAYAATQPQPLSDQDKAIRDALNGLSLAVTQAINASAGARNIQVVDVYNETLNGTTFGPTDIAADGHFNTVGYAKFADLFKVKLANFNDFDLVVDSLDDASSALTLRAALAAAANRPGADTVTFAPGLTGTINLTSALPALTGDLNLQGPGARSLEVRRAAGAATEFRIFNVASGANVSLSDLTISYGDTPSGAFPVNAGGGIYNLGNLTVKASNLTNNTGPVGGAIYSEGNLTIEDSSLRSNVSLRGGGIYSTTNADLATTKTVIRNSTISGNDAERGSGVYVNQGLTQILNSTITRNTSNLAQAVYIDGVASSSIEVGNSIISNNLNGNTPGNDVGTTQYPFVSNGYNVIGGGDNANFNATGDVIGVNEPKLSAYADNGGPTNTFAVQVDSPARNIGGTTSLLTDQRGTGFPRLRGARLDAGSFEAPNTAPTVSDLTALFNGTSAKTLYMGTLDPEKDTVTYSIVDQPLKGTLSAVNGKSVIYTPNPGFTGQDTFTFKANDGEFDSNTATYTIKASTAPALDNLSITATGAVGQTSEVGQQILLSLTVSDTDGANDIRLVNLILNQSLANNNGASLSYDPGTNKISLRNAQGQVVAGQAPNTVGTYDNGFVTIDFDDCDVVKAGNTLTVTFAITPGASFTGLKKAWAQARDTYGLGVGFSEMDQWTILPATPYVSQVVAQDKTTVLRPNITSLPLILPVINPDGVALTYSIVDAPTNGTLGVITGNRVTYTPGVNFALTGIDTFTFKANDGHGDSNTATYTIKYNGAPEIGELIVEKVVNPDAGTTSEVGQQLRLSLTVKDEDGTDNLRMVYLIFNKAQSHNNGASLEYDPGTNRIALRSAQGQLVAGQVAGTVGTQSNGFVTLDFGASSVTKNPVDKTITVSWVLTPETSFTGLKGVWAQARDIGGLSDGFDKLADWTITPAPAALRTKASKPSTSLY